MSDIEKKHIAMIHEVAVGLGELCDEVVFTGGAVVTLLITDRAAGMVRATDDVDVIAKIDSQRAY